MDLTWEYLEYGDDGDCVIKVRGVKKTKIAHVEECVGEYAEETAKGVLFILAVIAFFGVIGLLCWGGAALYAAMSLKLIVVLGIIAIVIAICARGTG
jgi:hypothetical protein